MMFVAFWYWLQLFCSVVVFVEMVTMLVVAVVFVIVLAVLVAVLLLVLQLLQYHTLTGPLALVFSTESGLVFGAFIGSSLRFVHLTTPIPQPPTLPLPPEYAANGSTPHAARWSRACLRHGRGGAQALAKLCIVAEVAAWHCLICALSSHSSHVTRHTPHIAGFSEYPNGFGVGGGSAAAAAFFVDEDMNCR